MTIRPRGEVREDPAEKVCECKKNGNAAQNRKVYNIIGVKVGREKAGTYICRYLRSWPLISVEEGCVWCRVDE